MVREVENGSVVRPGTFLKATLHAGRHFLLPILFLLYLYLQNIYERSDGKVKCSRRFELIICFVWTLPLLSLFMVL